MSSLGLRKNSARWENAAAFFASLLIHVFFLIAVAFVILKSASIPMEKPIANDAPPQLTILEMPPQAKPATRFVSTPAQEKLERKPNKDTAFESDNDSIAASTSAPSGQEALPSLEGREDEGLDLRDTRYVAGQAQAQSPSPPKADEKPAATPEPTPAIRLDSDLALLEAPKPTASPVQKTKKSDQPATDSKAGFQPEARVTRLRGNVSNRGKAALEANATPLGRYKKQVSDAIGSRWYYYVNSQMGLLNIGTVEIRFTVTQEGKIKSPQVLSNTSNESFASVSLSSVVNAIIPPMPPEVAKLVENGRLEIDFSFTIMGH